MSYSAKILKDSLSPSGIRLVTAELTIPRVVLSEFNTHRNFSRNSASSRAIPIEKMIERALNDTFIPFYWGKNQKGMAAEEELSPELQEAAQVQWLAARDQMIERVKIMSQIGVHKQITNRLLEPWLYQTIIVTATEWENFFGLRCNKDAQPEIKKGAEMLRDAIDVSTPKQLLGGQWHLPLTDDFDDLLKSGFSIPEIVKISVGRCARVSYLTHDGVRDPKADIELCDKLLKSGHLSPMEHAARPFTHRLDPAHEFYGNLRGWVSFRKLQPNERVFKGMK